VAGLVCRASKIKAHDKCFFLPCALDGAHNNTLVCRAF
jgi:hypothetical protein